MPEQPINPNKETQPRKPVQPNKPTPPNPVKQTAQPTQQKNHTATRPQQNIDLNSLKAKVKRLELVIDISKQFSATLNVTNLMNTILDRVTNALSAEACSFWMKNEKSAETICHVAVGPVKDKIIGLRLPKGEGIVGWVIENKQKTVVFDASTDERFSSNVDSKTSFITKSMLCVPLVVGDECVGCLQLINKKTQNGQFDQKDLELLELLAMNGAIAIKNAQLFQSEKRIKELNTLLEISKEITSTLNLDRVLISVVNMSSQVIHFRRALIALLDANNKIYLAAETDEAQVDTSTPENKKLQEIVSYVMDSGKSLHVVNYRKDTPPKNVPKMVLDYLDQQELKCISLMILADSEGKLGVMCMEGEYTSLVAKESNYVINLIVNQSTVAMRNAQLYKNIPSSALSGKFKSVFKFNKSILKKIFFSVVFITIISLIIALVPISHNISGEVEIIPKHTTQVSSLVDGVIEKVFFKEGQLVKKNDVLAVLDASLIKLEIAKQQKDKSIIRTDLRRLDSEEKSTDVHLKRLELAKLENEFELSNSKLSFTKVIAPSTGRIITQKPEELVDKQIVKGEIVTQIAVSDEKSGKILLDEKGVLEVSIGSPISIILQSMPDIIIRGEVTHVSYSKETPDDAGDAGAEDATSVPGYPIFFESEDINKLPSVRFGMTGLGKIFVGKKTLYRIHFKPIKDQLKTYFKILFFE